METSADRMFFFVVFFTGRKAIQLKSPQLEQSRIVPFLIRNLACLIPAVDRFEEVALNQTSESLIVV